MFATLCGGPEHHAGGSAFEPPRWGPRPWPWRRFSLPAADRPRTRTRPAGTYRVKVTSASFPPRQFVGQTSLMKIDVRNTGKKTVPALTVTVNIEGKEGEAARIPFAVHDPAGRASPTATARSGSSPRPTPAWPAPRPRAAPRPPRPDLSLRCAQAGQDGRSDLEAERGAPRQIHVAYEVDAGLDAETEGEDRLRLSRPAAPSSPTSRPRCRKPKSTPPAKSSAEDRKVGRTTPAGA